MSTTPPVNPDVHDIADRAKHAYATGTQLLAAMQYRLAELAGTGRLDPGELMHLQENLFHVWEKLYFGTLCAVRDEDIDDCTWDEAGTTYSDSRQLRIQIRIEPQESTEFHWEHNRFLLGDGAVDEHPRGTICYISPVNPDDDHIVDDRPRSTDFDVLRKRLLEATTDGGDEEDSAKTDPDDDME